MRTAGLVVYWRERVSPRASVMRRSVVSDGLRFPFSMSQMVVARMSTFSESSARVMPRDLRWFLMVAMISSCVIRFEVFVSLLRAS